MTAASTPPATAPARAAPLPDLVPEDLRLAIDATAIQAGLDPAGITAQTLFRDIDLDSLDRLELLMSLEQAGIWIDDAAVEDITSVADLARAITAHLSTTRADEAPL